MLLISTTEIDLNISYSRFLLGNSTAAKDDFIASVELSPALTQSWVKLASVYMELSDPVQTFESFEKAIAQNKDDPDIFYHRGQGASKPLTPNCQ